MTVHELRVFDEQTVLAILLMDPKENAWDLGSLSPGLFVVPEHRAIASALCDLRDTGRAIHWRRVRRMVQSRSAKAMVRPLFFAVGTSIGLTESMSRLIHAGARRAS